MKYMNGHLPYSLQMLLAPKRDVGWNRKQNIHKIFSYFVHLRYCRPPKGKTQIKITQLTINRPIRQYPYPSTEQALDIYRHIRIKMLQTRFSFS